MSAKREKAKKLAGELYRPADPLFAEHQRAQLLAQYNATSPDEMDDRTDLLRRLFGLCGDGTVIQPIFACDYGYNIRLGRSSFINSRLCADRDRGQPPMGPAVQFYTATHPLDADARRSGLEDARPIRIGSDVWVGGGAIILPGVTIEDRTVVGAGTVVIHDVPPASVVVGNPARIIRAVASSGGRWL